MKSEADNNLMALQFVPENAPRRDETLFSPPNVVGRQKRVGPDEEAYV